MEETSITSIDDDSLTESKAWDRCDFWIESMIFVVSVLGVFFITYGISQGFLLWLVSNILSIIYFIIRHQYPLVLQQVIFLITTLVGIIYNFNNIFNIFNF